MRRIKIISIAALCILFASCSEMPVDKTHDLKNDESPEISFQTPLVEETYDQYDDIHSMYISEMKKEGNNLNHFSDGKFSKEYCFYDIDKDGIDELIISGGYYSYTVFTCCEGEVVPLNWNKYGDGSIKIYPDEGIVFWTDGHKNHYFERFFRKSGDTINVLAEKSWEVKLTDNSKEICNQEYKISDKVVDKSEYKKYVKNIKAGEVVTHKELEWQR